MIMERSERNIAVLFPGIGYTCDKPLLYYTGKQLQGLGYEVIRLSYSGFPANVKGDEAKMRKCFAIQQEQTEEQLKDIDFSVYDDVLFVGKSLGTVAALQYAREFAVSARFVLLTPIEQTFCVAFSSDAIVFHGTADPWERTERITSACTDRKIPLYVVADANHSLETGDVQKDIDNLQQVIAQIQEFAGEAFTD